MSRLLILGAGGHGLVVSEAAVESGEWNEIAFLDDDNKKWTPKHRWPVVGSFAAVNSLRRQYHHVAIAIGNNSQRITMVETLLARAFQMPPIIHPTAYVSASASIGAGTVVLAQAAVAGAAVLGAGCIINTAASVDHECIVEDGVHISPGVHVAGQVRIGRCAWIGIGSSIKEGVQVGRDAVVGAGAAVVSDVCRDATVVGVPASAREVR